LNPRSSLSAKEKILPKKSDRGRQRKGRTRSKQKKGETRGEAISKVGMHEKKKIFG
jgi:hypothetical protein